MKENNTKVVVSFINGITENNGQPSISGGDVRALRILQEISKKGNHRVIVFTSTIGVKLINNYARKNWEVIDIKTSEKGDILARISRVQRSIEAIKKWWKTEDKKNKSYVLYSSCEHTYDVWPAWQLARKTGWRWMALIHWVPDSPWGNNRGKTPFIYNLIYYYQNLVAHYLIKSRATKILAVSDVTRQKLVDSRYFDQKKIETVYCGVDLEKIRKVDYQGKKKYDGVFLKRLNPGKGVYDLVEIWKKVVKNRPKAKLLVIGDGPDEVVKKVKEEIVEAGLEKNIILHGPEYDFNKKFEMLKLSKVFVLPTYEENWAIVIAEAIAAGLPVVCYDLPEIRPIWKNAVQWIKKGQTSLFAKRVLKILNERKKTSVLPKEVTEYSWKNISQKEYQLMKAGSDW